MTPSRRTLLRAAGAAAVATGLPGCNGAGAPMDGMSVTSTAGTRTETSDPSDGPTTPTATDPTRSSSTQSVTRRSLMAGTPDETPLVRIDAPEDGPTVLLVGGIHGDEVAGWKTATAVTGWEIDAGTLLVIPRATIRAVERRQRDHPLWGDANRMFPVDAAPRSPLGKALWSVVEGVAPDYVVDLHSSRGIYASGDGGVGQRAFRTAGLAEPTERAVEYLNGTVRPGESPAYEFTAGPMSGNYEMLTWKAHVDLGLPVVLFEVTEAGLDAETQIAWTAAFVAKLLDGLNVRPMGRKDPRSE